MNKTADTLPKFQTDYMFIRTVAESKTQPCTTIVETRSGVVISFMCARKGGYEDLTKEILRHFEAYVCRKVARERNARTMLRFAPKKGHQSNGFVEAVRGTSTMLPDTNRNEHWHAAFSNRNSVR